MRKRPAFTMVEILVVIGIIAILVALLLPAVLAAREAGRRTQCSNNLRQLGLATHNFENVYQYLPPSLMWKDFLNDPESMRALGITQPGNHSWEIFLLPYLEQNSAYEKYAFYTDGRDIPNKDSREIVIPGFICPTSPNTDKTLQIDYSTDGYSMISGARTDYSAVRMVDQNLTTQYVKQISIGGLGPLQPRRLGSFGSINDGLSNTLLYGEVVGRPMLYYRTHKTSTMISPVLWFDVNSSFVYTGHEFDGSAPGPCGINCNNNGFYSFHDGGMNAVMADASVRFVSEKTTSNVLASMITKSCMD